MTRSALRMAFIVLLGPALLSCGSEEHGTPEGPAELSVDILPHPDTLIAQGMALFQVTVTDEGGVPVEASVTWESSDTAIARADQDGWVRARRPGVVLVRARIGTAVDSAELVILPAVDWIVVTPADTVLRLDGTLQLTATLHDSLGNVLTGRRIGWRSLDTKTATVDSTGFVRLLVLDSATIVAESGPADGVIRVRAAETFESIRVEQFGFCAEVSGGKTACTGDAAMYGSGSVCDLNYHNSIKCEALHSMPAPLDTLIPTTSTRDLSCTLRGGAVTCWGYSSLIDLPYAGPQGRLPPHKLEGIPAMDEFVTGDRHACGLAGTAVWCWGIGDLGQVGQAGCIDWQTPCAPQVVAGLQAVSVAVGYLKTCAITTAQQVACWGVLGVDSTSGAWVHTSTPTVLDSVTGATSFAVTSGGAAICVLGATGEVWCWGDNSARQLGDGNGAERLVPGRVAGLPPLTSITGGNQAFCGLDGSGGAWCWGLAGYTGWNSPLANSTACGVTALCRVGPTHLNPGLQFTSISMGSFSTCGMATDGVAYCWGTGYFRRGGSWGDVASRAVGQVE